MTEMQKKYFENRIMELASKRDWDFSMFVADYRRAMKFYHAAKTGLGRTVKGEEERKWATRYSNNLLAKNYLHGEDVLSDRYSGMQKLEFLSEFESLVEELATA